MKRVDKVSTKPGSLSIAIIIGNLKTVRLYKVAGYPLFRGCLSIEVN